MSNQRSEVNNEKSNLISSKVTNYSIEGTNGSSGEKTKGRFLEIRNHIKEEAAKLKLSLINVVSKKPIPRNNPQKKDEILVNPMIKSTIVRISVNLL